MVFFINSTGGSSEPPRSSPLPTMFRRGLLHRDCYHEERHLTSSPVSTADGFPTLSSTLTPRGVAPHLLTCLHRRWFPMLSSTLTSRGAAPHLLARLHRRRLPGACVNIIDATRSDTSPLRLSPPPAASRHSHRRRRRREKHLTSTVVYTADIFSAPSSTP